jgi:hypothetical protein
MGFREMEYKNAFMLMGLCILGSSVLSFLIFIPGYQGLIAGENRTVDSETGRLLLDIDREEGESFHEEDERATRSA